LNGQRRGEQLVKRREFLTKSGLLVGGLPFVGRVGQGIAKPASSTTSFESQPESQISFETSDTKYQATYSRALDVLNRNATILSGYPRPVLIEGSSYSGIWLECAPCSLL
jgi:hypothetical protein